MRHQNERLTLMQSLFIQAYTAFNQETEGKPYLSALAAGCEGSKASVGAIASKWLNTTKIKDKINGIIAHREVMAAEKAGRTIEELDKMYLKAYDLGKKCNQPAAMNGSVTGIARLYGMDKDAGSGKSESPKPISLKDLEFLRVLARALTDKELEKPVLKLHTG